MLFGEAEVLFGEAEVIVGEAKCLNQYIIDLIPTMDRGVAQTTVSMICEMSGLQKRCYARRETL